MNIPESFQRISTALNASEIPYMLTGSFATAHYGLPRSTQDIDIVIDPTPEKLLSFIRSLDANQYYVDLPTALDALTHESLFNVIDKRTGWKIDLIFRKSRPFSREEFARRQRVSIEGFELFIASPEDVILAKLEWAKASASERQIQDAVYIENTEPEAGLEVP